MAVSEIKHDCCKTGWLFGTNAERHGKAKCCDNCDCDARREAGRNYYHELKASKAAKENALGNLSLVKESPTEVDLEPAPRNSKRQEFQEMGETAKATKLALDEIPRARERFPDLCVMAETLARGMDKPGVELRDVTSASRQLAKIMSDVRAKCPVRKDGPQAVEQLSPQARFFADFTSAAGLAAGQ